MKTRFEQMEDFLRNIAEEIMSNNNLDYDVDYIYEKLESFGLEKEDIECVEEDREILKKDEFYTSEGKINSVLRRAQGDILNGRTDETPEKRGKKWIELTQFPKFRTHTNQSYI